MAYELVEAARRFKATADELDGQADRLAEVHRLAQAALYDKGPEALTGAKTEALMAIRELAES
jgi:hypothetical protein